MAYAVVAHYRCEPTDEAVVRAALLQARAHSRKEPGNLVYEVHAEEGRPGGFVLYETYADRAHFDAHALTEHFVELIVGTVRPLLTERTVTFAELL